MTLKEFIQEHENDDTARLMLSGNRWPDIDIDKAVTIIECRKKIRTKLPEWYEIPEIIYPDRLSSEQSSSSATAKYKASIASRTRHAVPPPEARCSCWRIAAPTSSH